ncbi:MAG: ATP-binding cassette domain-containing protein, partial [Anaerovoracaceae bacterium]
MNCLKALNIQKSFDGKKIIDGINITLKKGEIVSLLGVSGSGKTTLFNVLSGLLVPEEGSVLLDDEDITGKPGRISYMLQKDLLFDHKKIIDNVSLP